MREIAEEFSYSKTHVRDLLLKYNIPLRKRSERYSSRCLTYGKRRVSCKVVDHKGELRTIDTIKQMYSEGLSVSAIARFFNTMKVPTKQQGKGWHHHTIAQILKRERVYVGGRRGMGWTAPSTAASTSKHSKAHSPRGSIAIAAMRGSQP